MITIRLGAVFAALALSAVLASPALACDKCFGAAGQQCGSQPGPDGALLRAAFCALPPSTGARAGICGVNSGSFLHDECCVAHPNGLMCGGNNSSSQCTAEWNRAVNRTVTFRMWTRGVDYTVDNSSGTVVHASYCGKSGARVRKNDARFCCSRDVAMPGLVERIAFPATRYCK